MGRFGMDGETLMATRFFSPAKGSKTSRLASFIRSFPKKRRRPEPAQPLLGRLDLSPVSQDPTPGEDGLVAEISASVAIANRLYTISSGGGNRVSLSDWSDPNNPKLVQQLDLNGFFTTSVASFGNLIAIATTPENYDDPTNLETPESQIRFYTLNPAGKLTEAGVVNTGFLTDGMRFSADGRQLYIANEGQPNADYSVDPVGSVSIIRISGFGGNRRFSEAEVTFPDLDASGVELLGSGIRFNGKTGVTTSFAQDAEPEYVSAAGGYLFVTLQENNTVARINLATNQVEAYIGLGWVDYSKVSVDLTDQDQANGTAPFDGFNPLSGQNVAGLRMADGIAAWKQGRNVYFATANEGDAREYTGFLDERRDGSLSNGTYATVPGRLKLIVNNASDSTLRNQALVFSNNLTDTDPTNDFTFESGSRTGTPVSFGSRSLSLFDGITGQLLWDSWMTDFIGGTAYNTSLQNIAQFAGVYDDGRSDDKGVEPESVVALEYNRRRYVVGALERTTAGDKTIDNVDPVTQGGLLVVYDVTDVSNVDFVTYQQVSRSPEGLEVINSSQSPTGRVLLGVSAEFDSNSVEYLDFGAVLNNGNGAAYLASDLADPTQYATLPAPTSTTPTSLPGVSPSVITPGSDPLATTTPPLA
jgi:YVTN family beta-propeller protein